MSGSYFGTYESGGLPPITAFSYSRYRVWVQCPRKAYYQFVAKLPMGEPSPALEKGLAAHEIAAEIYRGGWPPVDGMPPSLGWRHVLAKHKSFYGSDLEAELQVAFDKDWKPTSWFDKRTVYRCAFDGFAYTPAEGNILKIYEHKTGKKYPEDHAKQAEWYAGVGTLLVPDAEVISVDINYLDYPPNNESSVLTTSFHRIVATAMLDSWRRKADAMMEDTEFPTRAGYHCRWCPFANSKGGPCSLG